MEADEKTCPRCAETVKAAAKVCRFCGHEFDTNEALAAEAEVVPPKDEKNKNTAVGCLVVLGVLTLLLFQCGGNDADQGAGADAAEVTEVADADRQKGFHCLSAWDGSNRSTVDQVKAGLRNPDSFEHIETSIHGNNEGEHGLWMEYRAENGFGGMNVERIYARVDHESCEARVLPGGPGSG